MAERKWIQSLSILEVEPKRVAISAAVSGDNTLIPAVAGKKLCVLGVFLMAGGAVNATFYSGPPATGKALSGPVPMAANGGFVVPPSANPEMHWIETAAGEALVLKLDSAVQVSGFVVYYEN
jgi:hypothetical protein